MLVPSKMILFVMNTHHVKSPGSKFALVKTKHSHEGGEYDPDHALA